MSGEKIEHGAEHGRIADPGAQGSRGEAGEREQAFGPALAQQDPAEGAKGERLRIDGG